MTHSVMFGEVLEAADSLPPDEQQMLIDIMQRRLHEQRRDEIKSEVAESRRDFAAGNFKQLSTEEIMLEVER